MTNQRRGRPAKANVQVRAVPRIVSAEEEFLLTNSGDVQTVERYNDDVTSGGARITHIAAGRVQMWKPGTNGTYTPRTVSESSKAINLAGGWKITCPDCGTNHEDSPYPPGEPNSCPARAHVPMRLCPVADCNSGNGKRIYDTLGLQSRFEGEDEDPDIIKDDAFENTTAETRTRILLDWHLWTFHPRYAQATGRPPLPQASRQYDGAVRPA